MKRSRAESVLLGHLHILHRLHRVHNYLLQVLWSCVLLKAVSTSEEISSRERVAWTPAHFTSLASCAQLFIASTGSCVLLKAVSTSEEISSRERVAWTPAHFTSLASCAQLFIASSVKLCSFKSSVHEKRSRAESVLLGHLHILHRLHRVHNYLLQVLWSCLLLKAVSTSEEISSREHVAWTPAHFTSLASCAQLFIASSVKLCSFKSSVHEWRDLEQRACCLDTCTFYIACIVCTTIYCKFCEVVFFIKAVSTSEEISSRERVAWTPAHFTSLASCAQLFIASYVKCVLYKSSVHEWRDLEQRACCLDTCTFYIACIVCTTIYCKFCEVVFFIKAVSTSEEISSRERVAWTPAHFTSLASCAQLFIASSVKLSSFKSSVHEWRDLEQRACCLDTCTFYIACIVCTTIYCKFCEVVFFIKAVSTSEEISSREHVAWTPAHFTSLASCAQLFIASSVKLSSL